MIAPFEELLRLLADPNAPIPVDRLPDLSDPTQEELQALAEVWDQLPSDRRRALIDELGRLADLHIELLYERINRMALADSDAQVRRIAISNLWECRDPKLAPRLVEALRKDRSSQVRAAAANALGSFVLMGEMEEIDSPLRREIENMLLDAASHDRAPSVRVNALESLGYSSRGEVRSLIRASFHSENQQFRRSALLAMGRSADARWKEEVLHSLHSAEADLRMEAARAAGELELENSVAELIELLEDASGEVRHAATWSLGQVGGPAAEQALVDLLESAHDPKEKQLIEDALDHLAFVDGTRDMLLFDFGETEDPSV
jgi:HEAT repeat protein